MCSISSRKYFGTVYWWKKFIIWSHLINPGFTNILEKKGRLKEKEEYLEKCWEERLAVNIFLYFL